MRCVRAHHQHLLVDLIPYRRTGRDKGDSADELPICGSRQGRGIACLPCLSNTQRARSREGAKWPVIPRQSCQIVEDLTDGSIQIVLVTGFNRNQCRLDEVIELAEGPAKAGHD